jgi:hypothetical protein
MYDILSLTNSPLLTADMILLCAKKPVRGIRVTNRTLIEEEIGFW